QLVFFDSFFGALGTTCFVVQINRIWIVIQCTRVSIIGAVFIRHNKPLLSSSQSALLAPNAPDTGPHLVLMSYKETVTEQPQPTNDDYHPNRDCTGDEASIGLGKLCGEPPI